MDNATIEAVKHEVAQISTLVEDKLDAGIKPVREEVDRIAQSIQALEARQKEARRHELAQQFGGSLHVASGPYEGFDPVDMAIVRAIHQAQLRDPHANERSAQLQEWGTHIAAAMDSLTSGSGEELVPTALARQLWMDVNLDTLVLPQVPRIPMPTNPFDIPLQLGDVNWFPGTQNTATTETALATDDQRLTAKELVAEVQWSYDLDEDAVIAMRDEIRRTLRRNAAEVIDDVLLNADTTTTNNINHDGSSLSTSTAGKAQYLIGWDGLIHRALIDNDDMATALGGAVSTDAYLSNRKLLGKYGVRPTDCVHVTDLNTYLTSLGMDGVQTVDKYGPNATILRGELARVHGVPVIVSAQMQLAAATGKINASGTGNTTGRILTFNPSQYRVGFRREILIEADKDIKKRQNLLVVSFRLAFTGRNTPADQTDTSLTYNITGVS